MAAIEIKAIPEVALALATLLALAALLAVVTARLRIPLTLILVIVGFAAGELARSNGVDLPLEGEAFEEVLVFVFLPALVFEAALGLPARVFVRELIPILTLAVIGLLISAGLVGLALHLSLGISITAALLFGALISATDPVAVTATFRELGVPNRLLVLVEGESLLNDGIAIVLFNILLVAALGTSTVGVGEGVLEFLYVFLGGAALGATLGLAVAEIASRLGQLPSTALTIALAYGSFALGEVIFGFSGVMASVAAGIVLSGLSRTLINSAEVEVWHGFWHSLSFVANGILFILIGVVIEADLIVDNLDSIAIGIAAVVVSRPLAVLPLMPIVTKLARIPSVGLRNQMVLVWGGLRGGVALALALAIPEALAERDQFVAMTAGVVLATLIINATTIGALIRRLGLDQPSRIERVVAAAARFDGARTARGELSELLAGTDIDSQLAAIEGAAAAEIASLRLEPGELEQALLRRGLAVERATLQELVDHRLVPQWHARVALNALDDMLEELGVGRPPERGLFETRGFSRLVYEVARRIHLGKLTAEKWVEVAYRDLQARLKATAAAIDGVRRFAPCPGIDAQVLEQTIARFHSFHEKAEADLALLEAKAPAELVAAARRHYSSDLARLASIEELHQLAELGLCSSQAEEHAAASIADELERAESGRIEVTISPDEDVGV